VSSYENTQLRPTIYSQSVAIPEALCVFGVARCDKSAIIHRWRSETFLGLLLD
jgi:hypothetical protein